MFLTRKDYKPRLQNVFSALASVTITQHRQEILITAFLLASQQGGCATPKVHLPITGPSRKVPPPLHVTVSRRVLSPPSYLMSSRIKRTYSRRDRSTLPSSSPPPEDPAPEPPTSSPSSTPHSPPIPKRSLSDALIFRPPAKKPRLTQPEAKRSLSSLASSSKWKPNPKKQSLIQLHFSIDVSVLRKCPICDLSYTKGAQDDEVLHKSHCARIQRGLEWTKAETKESVKRGVAEIDSGIRLKDGSLGRILAVNANVTGKIGSKVPPFHPLSPRTRSSDRCCPLHQKNLKIHSSQHYSKPLTSHYHLHLSPLKP